MRMLFFGGVNADQCVVCSSQACPGSISMSERMLIVGVVGNVHQCLLQGLSATRPRKCALDIIDTSSGLRRRLR
jgi:hypothetical protein